MGTKRYVNRAKSGAVALPAQWRRRKGAVRARLPVPPAAGLRPHDRGGKVAREERSFAAAATALAEQGWFVCRDFANPRIVDALADEAHALWRHDAFDPAGVGRGEARQVLPERRGDWLHWLDPARPTAPQRDYLALMERFRDRLNRELFLSLQELELQYAVYPPGRHYERHVDQLEGAHARLITVLLYLNRGWHAADAGQLRIYAGSDALEPSVEVLPEHNTFVCFRSAGTPHEVLAPLRERFSLGGWFRVRAEIPLPGAAGPRER